MLELKQVDTPKIKADYLEGGSGDVLVYLHGAGGITADDPFLTRLAEDYHIYAPFLPGYGESEEAENIRDMLDFTLHTYDVLERIGVSEPILVGHSMGGMIAAEMAAIAPNEIDCLALIAPAGLWLDDYPVPDLFTLMPYEYPQMLFHDQELGVQLMTSGMDLENPEFLQDFLVRNARQLGMAGKILFPIPERGLSERLYRIKADTMIIWGESDKLIDPAYADAFADGIDGANLTMIQEAGHMVQLEKADEVIEAIEKIV
ncbi:MAG: alpha/beta fold hydrolase [Pseudomonadota bacterium]